MKVGFLGPRGTFTEEALDTWINKHNFDKEVCEKIAFPSIADVMNAVGTKIDMAVVPIENSFEGSVNTTIDSFIHGISAKIKGEIILPVAHHLFANSDIPLNAIRQVYSHPQALFQCQRFLRENLPQAIQKETSSTAQAGDLVSKSGKNIAAIGSISLSKIYNIKILVRNIQSSKNNMTRFYLISNEDEKVTGRDKTTITFSVENRPGSLYDCLKIFAENGLNLCKIESRPSRKVFGEYVFFIELEGHRLQEPLKSALKELTSIVGFCKVLGSYPIYDLPKSNS